MEEHESEQQERQGRVAWGIVLLRDRGERRGTEARMVEYEVSASHKLGTPGETGPENRHGYRIKFVRIKAAKDV